MLSPFSTCEEMPVCCCEPALESGCLIESCLAGDHSLPPREASVCHQPIHSEVHHVATSERAPLPAQVRQLFFNPVSGARCQSGKGVARVFRENPAVLATDPLHANINHVLLNCVSLFASSIRDFEPCEKLLKNEGEAFVGVRAGKVPSI